MSKWNGPFSPAPKGPEQSMVMQMVQPISAGALLYLAAACMPDPLPEPDEPEGLTDTSRRFRKALLMMREQAYIEHGKHLQAMINQGIARADAEAKAAEEAAAAEQERADEEEAQARDTFRKERKAERHGLGLVDEHGAALPTPEPEL